MKFNTDSHFVIGNYHIRQNKPCQDHALHADKLNAAMVCISDGCSSGRHTDIGARVMTLSTIRALKERNLRVKLDAHLTSMIIDGSIDTHSSVSKEALSITNEDMLATCVYAVVNEKGGYIHMLGDGVCVVKYSNGDMLVVSLKWQQNTPFYPVYQEDISKFIALHSAVDKGRQALEVDYTIIRVDGEIISHSAEYIPIERAIHGYISEIFDPSVVECVAVFSDGIQDFQTAERKQVDTMTVVKEMMGFKNHTGEFVKRRVSAALKSYAKQGIHPNDDFSMAAIYFDHEQEIENNETEKGNDTAQ